MRPLALSVVVTLGLAACGGGAASDTADRAPVRARDATAVLARAPLTFVPNRGQSARPVRFEARTGGVSMAFTARRAVLGGRGHAVGLAFGGARRDVQVTGEDATGAHISYLRGADPGAWQRDLPGYARVRYRGLWRGIDLRFHGDGDHLKYELTLAPGARPRAIALAYEGATRVRLARDGDLLIDTPGGTLRDARPAAFQRIGGRRVAVASRFVLRGGTRFGFALGRYDRSRALVIDPGLAYATFLGGAGSDEGYGIAVDAAGNAYVTGYTSGGVPTTAGAFDTSYNANGDAFVTKLNATGTALVYSTVLGGSGEENTPGFGAIAVDGFGSAYVTGYTESSDFPTSSAFDESYNDTGDAFVTKLNPTGTAPIYSTYLGGSAYETAHAIAVDDAGAAYVVGEFTWVLPHTTPVPFPLTAGAADTSFGGEHEGFVTKLAANGASLAYSTLIGGSDLDWAFGVAVRDGAAYVTGVTYSGDFPVTAGAYDTDEEGSSSADAFAAKLNATGSAFTYATYLGKYWDGDAGNAIAVDATGRAIVVGSTQDDEFPTTAGAFQTTFGGGFNDAFVSVLSPAGDALAWSTYLGGSGSDTATGVAVDGSAPVVAGETSSAAFPTTDGTSGAGAFVTRVGATGGALSSSTILAGAGAAGVAVDASGAAYVTGTANTDAFPATAGAFDTARDGNDAFVAKLGIGPEVRFTASAVSVNESANGALVTVERRGGTDGPATVKYATANATAHAGADYTAASGTLSFAGGEVSKQIGIPILNDTGDEPDETFTITLSEPSGPALGDPKTVTVTIVDDDLPPDNDPPVTSIELTPPAEGDVFGDFVNVRVFATDNIQPADRIGTFCVLDPPTPPASFFDITSQCPYLSGGTVAAPGTHTIYAASTDGAGNFENVKKRTFRIVPSPDTVITEGPSGTVWSLVSRFSFTSSISGSTFECRLDGAAWAACAAPFDTAALASGEHVFEVRAKSPEGAYDPTPAQRSFTVGAPTAKRLSCKVQPVRYWVITELPRGTFDNADQYACYVGPPLRFGCAKGTLCTYTDERCPQDAYCKVTVVANWYDADRSIDWRALAEVAVERTGDSRLCSTGLNGDRCRAEATASALGTGAPIAAACSTFIYAGIASYGVVLGSENIRRIECSILLEIYPAVALQTLANGSRLQVYAPGAGTMVVASTPQAGSGRASAAAVPKPKIATARRSVTARGPVTVALKLNAAAKRALKRKHKLATRVRVTFTPAGGTPVTKTTRVTLTSAAPRPKRCRIVPKPAKRPKRLPAAATCLKRRG